LILKALDEPEYCVIEKTAPRKGWAKAFECMHESGDEALVIADDLDADLMDKWKIIAEILPEKDGSVTISIDSLKMAVNAPTREAQRQSCFPI